MKIFLRLNCFVAAVLFSGMFFLLLLNSGCEVLTTGAVVGTPTQGDIVYRDGDLSATLYRDYTAVTAAAHHAASRLQLARAEEVNQEFIAKLTTRTADGEAVHITVTKLTNDLTKVDIQADNNDEHLARNILAEIRKY